jgi:hypothetical protein
MPRLRSLFRAKQAQKGSGKTRRVRDAPPREAQLLLADAGLAARLVVGADKVPLHLALK